MRHSVLLTRLCLTLPGVNFINVLMSSLHAQIPKEQKRFKDYFDVFITLSGSEHVKAARRMLFHSILT